MSFFSELATSTIDTYQNSISKRKGYRCAHCETFGGESCSEFAKRILLTEKPLFVAHQLISKRLASCQSASQVASLNFLQSALTMGYHYGKLAAALFILTGLVFGGVGCGGGGGVSDTAQEKLDIQGTVAVGAPISGAIVNAKCTTSSWNSAASDSSGTFKISAFDRGPCQLSTTLSDGTKLRSFYINGSVANITPLTELVVQLADGQPENKNAAVAQVLSNLPKAGVDITTDPIETRFVPDGSGLDLSILKYVELASKTSIAAPSDLQRASVLSSEWANQCRGLAVCAPVQISGPVAAGAVETAEVTWWQELYRWADTRVQGLTNGAKSIGSSLAIEAKAVYVEGFLTERSEKQNQAIEDAIQVGNDFYDGNWTAASAATINNIWTYLETGLESADLIEKPYRLACYVYLREKNLRGGFSSYVEYEADKSLCDLEAKLLNLANIVKGLKDSTRNGIKVFNENKSLIKNGIKHLVKNGGGWRTRAINRGRSEYIKHLHTLSKNSIQTNLILDANERISFMKDNFDLFREALRGFGYSDSEIATYLEYSGEVPTNETTSTAPIVSLVVPTALVQTMQRTLTVQGAHISPTAILTVEDTQCGEPFNRSASGFQQVCIPQAAGNKTITVKEKVGGSTLFTGSVEVRAGLSIGTNSASGTTSSGGTTATSSPTVPSTPSVASGGQSGTQTLGSGGSATTTTSPAGPYTKVSTIGYELPDTAALGYGPNDWACTRENATGLMWEVKQPTGPRMRGVTYTYFTSLYDLQVVYRIDDYTPGFRVPTLAEFSSDTNAPTYIRAANANRLCGRSSWGVSVPKENFPAQYFGELTGAYWASENTPTYFPCPYGGCNWGVSTLYLNFSYVPIGLTSTVSNVAPRINPYQLYISSP